MFPYVQTLAERTGTGESRITTVVFSDNENELLDELAYRESRRGDPNRLMKRGALLHTDIAIAGGVIAKPEPPSIRRPLKDPYSRSRRTTIVADDGQMQGFDREGVHWEFARMLLDTVVPAPPVDPMVLLWYQAVAAHFARTYNLAEIVPHLERARALFPADPALLLASGAAHEALASPRIQAVVNGTTLPRGVEFAVPSISANLRDAGQYFRAALQADPEFAEARVRLGRVLSLRGEPGDARRELLSGTAATEDPVLLYYGHLFLADVEEALGNLDAAAAAYRRASALYPLAQSPHLGLSHLARLRGDGPAALEAIEKLVDLPEAAPDRHDEWWDYAAGPGRRTDELFDRLWEPFRGESP